MRTRTARLVLAGYLLIVIHVDIASFLARNGVAFLPLSITDYPLFGEVSVGMPVVAVVLILFLFRHPKQQQQATPAGAWGFCF